MKWSKKFPKKAGNYWFYGYRYGMISCGQPQQPEWMIIKIRKIPNGVIGVDSNGQFIHEQETKGGQFAPLELPEFPKVREPFTESCEKCYGHGTIMGPKTCPDCKGEGGR
jgi:hypothetical protein